MFIIESFLIGIASGIVSGIIIGIIIKFKIKTNQEKVFEINRNTMLEYLLKPSTWPYSRIKEIWKILEASPDFNASKNCIIENSLSDSEYDVISHYVKFVQQLLENLLRFSECSTFVTIKDYLIIKGYLQSSLFVGLFANSPVNTKNPIHYNYKIMKDHAFFAKEILENYPKLLSKDFILDWTKILQDENLFTLTGLQKGGPGSIVPSYKFKFESVFGRHTF